MKELLENYRGKVKEIREELSNLIDEGTDLSNISRLVVKYRCYKIFVADLEKVIPHKQEPVRIDKEAEAKRLKQIEDREKEDAEFKRRLLAGDFETKEYTPEGF